MSIYNIFWNYLGKFHMEKSALVEIVFKKWRNRFYFCQLYIGSEIVFHHQSKQSISFIFSFNELGYFFSPFSWLPLLSQECQHSNEKWMAGKIDGHVQNFSLSKVPLNSQEKIHGAGSLFCLVLGRRFLAISSLGGSRS